MILAQRNFLFLGLILGFIFCCSPINSSTTSINSYPKNQRSQELGFHHPLQIIAPDNIKSVYLGNSNRAGLPIIRMGKSSTLTLSFDEITDYPTTFGVRFKRFTKDWKDDGLVATQKSNGQLEALLVENFRSESSSPTYFSFSYRFPNQQIGFKLSGNWMVEVYNYHSGDVVFSMPFFVTEEIGKTDILFETLNEISYPSRYQHQFFVNYSASEQIRMPEFSISMFMIQDGRFSETKELDIKDITRMHENVIQFHHSRSNLFLANYDIQKLDLRNFQENQKIRFVEERSEKAPLIFLNDDDPAFNQTNTNVFDYLPLNSRANRYGDVNFSFLTDVSLDYGSEIYVTGTFTNWALKPENKLSWNSELNRYTTSILLKQGNYAYSYELVRNGNIQPNALQNDFGATRRSYAILVYYSDDMLFLDRLVNISEIETK